MSAGKGDKPRPYSGDKFREGWERAFGKKPETVWDGFVRTEVEKFAASGKLPPYITEVLPSLLCEKCLNDATRTFSKAASRAKRGKTIHLCDACADAARASLTRGHGYKEIGA